MTGISHRCALAATLVLLSPAALAASPVKDGCFEATLPAWMIGENENPDRTVTLRGLYDGGPPSIRLQTELAESNEHWTATFRLLGNPPGEFRPGEYRFKRLAEIGDDSPIELTVTLTSGARRLGTLSGGSVTVDASGAGSAAVTLYSGPHEGTLRAVFAPRGLGGNDVHLRECFAADDPRARAADPETVDAGGFEGSLSPGVTMELALVDAVAVSGPATVGIQDGQNGVTNGRLQPLVLCDADGTPGFIVNVRSRHHGPPGGPAVARVDVELGNLRLSEHEVPVVTGPAPPAEGEDWIWLRESEGEITGALHLVKDAMLTFRDQVIQSRLHTVTFAAEFRAVSFDERVRLLAGNRDVHRMPPKERHALVRKVTCGIAAAYP